MWPLRAETRNQNAILTARQRWLVWVWVALSLWAVHYRGQQLGLDETVSDRVRYHAIPVAISSLYHGWPHDYTASKSLAMGLQRVGPLNPLIAEAVARRPGPDDGVHYWAADDRGMADYVIAAFFLFGPEARSLYSFYFVVLGASCLLFLLDAGRHAGPNVVLILALGALYSCLSVIPHARAFYPTMEPAALFEPRMIELLTFVATLHLAFTGFIDRSWTRVRVAAAVGQAVLLGACYHARSSVGWQIAFIAAACAVNAVRMARATHRAPTSDARPARPRLLAALGPVVLVGIGLGALTLYKSAAYNPRYFDDMGARAVWHNALMGLSSNAHLAATYGLAIDDRAIIYAVIGRLRETRDARLTADWTDENIRNSLGGHSVFNWFVYEQAARDVYRHIWRADWPSVLQCYLIDKPARLVRVFWGVSRLAAASQSIGKYFVLNQLTPGALIIILPALLIAMICHLDLTHAVAGSVALLPFSASPPLLFYPVVPATMGAFATVSLVIYLAIAMLLAAVRGAASRS